VGTAAQPARARGVARQRIQNAADEAHAADLVHFRDNPNYRRSQIIVLMRDGSNAFEMIDKEL
jgi:hypothetical protein